MLHTYHKTSVHARYIWHPISEFSLNHPATFTANGTQTQPSNYANGLISQPYNYVLSEDNYFYTVPDISEGEK
jgi:hypothetical protein